MADLIDKLEEQVKLENTRIEEQIRGANVRISQLESAKKTSSEEELKLIEIRIDELNLTKKRIQLEWKSNKTRMLERLKRILENGGCDPADRNLKLQFRNKISESILTGEELKGEENISIEVALVDSTENNIVEIGQESSAKVEIVVLNGGIEDGLTGEGFKDKIVPEMEGRKSLLKGNVHVKLQRGKGFLEKISFRHHTIKMKPPRFRLGARIVNQIFDGVRVKEAMTEPFIVKDFRNKYYRKHKNPLLSDEVSRLINIRKGGKIAENLKDNKIETVKDFLIQLLIDPEGLKRIVHLGQKKWEAIVNNARACRNDGKMYCYINDQQKMGVVFNVLGEVLGLYSKNQYATTTVLSENHQVAQELLLFAYTHWDDVKTFDDENALEKYLTGLSTPMDPSDSLRPDYLGEIIGEPRSRSNFLFQNISSATNVERGFEDSRYFSTDDVPIIDYDFLQPNSIPGERIRPHPTTVDPQTLFQDFDFEEFLQLHDNLNPIADEQIAATAGTFVEPGDVEMSNPQKRWENLLCV